MLLADKIRGLQNICKMVSNLKSQIIDELPHYGHDALFLKNNEITTGLLKNVTEIKIHLITGNLMYFHSEQGNLVDLIHDNVSEQVRDIVTKYGLNVPEIVTRLTNLRAEDLSYYLAFARKANESLELFRMRLREHFTQVHLWPHGFDFSVEWFTGKNEQQIGIGISPGHDQYGSPYLYVSPYPFDENVTKEVLPVGIWHTDGWNGIKVEWKELENKLEQEISMQIFDLYVIAKRNFE